VELHSLDKLPQRRDPVSASGCEIRCQEVERGEETKERDRNNGLTGHEEMRGKEKHCKTLRLGRAETVFLGR